MMSYYFEMYIVGLKIAVVVILFLKVYDVDAAERIYKLIVQELSLSHFILSLSEVVKQPIH